LLVCSFAQNYKQKEDRTYAKAIIACPSSSSGFRQHGAFLLLEVFFALQGEK